MLTAEVYTSAGSSWLYIPKMLERPEMFCEFSLPVTEATDLRLKALFGLMVK